MTGKLLLASVIALTICTTDLFAQTSPSLKPPTPGPQLRPTGLQVLGVVPGSTAARQGIERGDIIVGVEGQRVRSEADLAYLLRIAGRVAMLQVVDCRTGWQQNVLVYPVAGKIGVILQPVPFDRPLGSTTPGSVPGK
jgi:membrane-associated protease RseP (regulator of RpoE activity)